MATVKLTDLVKANKLWLSDRQLVETNPLVPRIQRQYHRMENPFHYLCTVGRGSLLEPEYSTKIIYTTWVDDSRMVSSPTILELMAELIYDATSIHHCPIYEDWVKRYFKSRVACDPQKEWFKYIFVRQRRSYNRLVKLLGIDRIALCLDKKNTFIHPERSNYPSCIYAMTKKSFATVNSHVRSETKEISSPSTFPPVPVQAPIPVAVRLHTVVV